MEDMIKKLRLRNNGVTDHFNDVYECVNLLHGIQAQYDLYAYIALMNRVDDFSLKELYCNDKIVKSWGQRVTLHINTKENMRINKAVFSNSKNWIKKYVKELGGDCEAIIDQIVNADYDDRFFSKTDVQNKIEHRSNDQMMKWGGVLAQASIEGFIYEVIYDGKEKKYAKTEKKYLNKKLGYDSAICRLIEKYITAFGPVSENDFAHWSGLRKCDFKENWDRISDRYEQLNVGNEMFCYKKTDEHIEDDNVLLLGKFDPLLLAYNDKTWLVEEKCIKKIWKSAGQVEGVLLVDNSFAGTWHCTRKNGKLFFCLCEERKIRKKIMDKVIARMKFISDGLGMQYGGISVEQGDCI